MHTSAIHDVISLYRWFQEQISIVICSLTILIKTVTFVRYKRIFYSAPQNAIMLYVMLLKNILYLMPFMSNEKV